MGFFNQSAMEIELRNSTLGYRYFLQSIKEDYTNGRISLRELFTYVRNYVDRSSREYDLTILGHSFDFFTRLLVTSDLTHKIRTNQELK